MVGLAGVGFLVVGLLLSKQWSAERSVRIQAPPETVFIHVDSLALWDEWTVWGDVESRFDGPGRGKGARRAWDDPRYGEGTFTVVESDPPSSLRYEVVVEGGALKIRGSLRLAPEDGGTRVTWREEGTFGRNPLLGYVARSMARSQAAEMERSLARLEDVVAAAR